MKRGRSTTVDEAGQAPHAQPQAHTAHGHVQGQGGRGVPCSMESPDTDSAFSDDASLLSSESSASSGYIGRMSNGSAAVTNGGVPNGGANGGPPHAAWAQQQQVNDTFISLDIACLKIKKNELEEKKERRMMEENDELRLAVPCPFSSPVIHSCGTGRRTGKAQRACTCDEKSKESQRSPS